jgi:hypothetical protein
MTAMISMVSGCAPDPTPLCEHMAEVMKDDGDKPHWVDTLDKCVDHYEKVKSRYGVNTYRRESECTLASDTAFKIRKCMKDQETWRQGPQIN